MNGSTGHGLFQGLPGYDIVLLLLGCALFLLLAIAFIVLLTQKRKVTMLLPFFILAIVMIGFPAIKSFKGGGFEVDIQNLQTQIAAVENNPHDATARGNLLAALQRTESAVTTNNVTADVAENLARGQAALDNNEEAVQWAGIAFQKDPNSEPARMLLARTRVAKYLPKEIGRPLTAQAHSNLLVFTRELNQSTALTPQAYYTLSQAQLALANTNAAATNLIKAMKANTNLVVDPKMKILLKPNLFRLPP